MPEARHPSPSDSAPSARAARLLRRHAPDYAARTDDARVLGDSGRERNVLVVFSVDGETYVLKRFGTRPGDAVRTLLRPISRHVARAFVLWGVARERAANEYATIRRFREAGHATFDLVAQTSPVALLYRHHPGRHLRAALRDAPETLRPALVHRFASDVGRRQAQALADGDRSLVHGHPRVQHAYLTADDELLHFDFEAIPNDALPLETLLAYEADRLLGSLARFAQTATRECLDAAADGLGAAAMARWRGLPRRASVFAGNRPLLGRMAADRLLTGESLVVA